MILAECGVFAAMCLAGAVSGAFAVGLDALGRLSRLARAVGDILIAVLCGAAYFFTRYYAASGEFRLYSLIAFFAGLIAAMRILKRAEPRFRAILRRLLIPIADRYRRAEAALRKRLAPLLSRVEERRRKRLAHARARREKRAALRAGRASLRQGKAERKPSLSEGCVIEIKRRGKGRRKSLESPLKQGEIGAFSRRRHVRATLARK